MEKDQEDLLKAFNNHNVDYLIVGGQAVNAYGEPRYTKDLDVFIRCSISNSEAAYRALAEFGAPLEGVQVQDLRDGTTVYQIGVEPGRVDILQKLEGIVFEKAWQNRIVADIGDDLRAHLISIHDLIDNKLAVGRPQDIADAAKLKSNL